MYNIQYDKRRIIRCSVCCHERVHMGNKYLIGINTRKKFSSIPRKREIEM